MSAYGWAMMCGSIGLVLSLLTYCLVRVLGEKPDPPADDAGADI